MVEYKDFSLTTAQIDNLKQENARHEIKEFIKEHGVEPEDIEDFYNVSDESIERYRKACYSIYYTRIRKINEIIKKDYDELFAESGNMIYWESHIVLNKKLEDAKDLFEIFPKTIENIFEINKVVIRRTTNLLTGEKTEIREQDEWYNSHRIYPEDTVLELGDALKIYWESDVRRTTGDKIVLRRPINPIFEHPYYIIGQQDSPLFVFVDSVTGNILSD